MSDSCIFCRIVAGSIPAAIIAENDRAIAFRDLNPQAPVHVLVIPRRHTDSLATATVPNPQSADGASDPLELAAVLSLVGAVARQEGLEHAGYRVVTNIGEHGGQSVPHLHFHVLGGRHMTWPPG